MEIKQFYVPGLAHLSYLMIGKEACFVVDPAREVSPYLSAAEKAGVPIVAVLETHLHADFLSGHCELAALTGAEIYISQKADAAFAHHALEDRARFQIDHFDIEMLETSGHTPEGSVFLVTDLSRGNKGTMLFSGDTLLVGDVGRPDLFPALKGQLAQALFDSIRKLETLEEYIEVYPAHGAGSLCGKKLSAKRWSTLGVEKLFNSAFQQKDAVLFQKELLEEMPPAPDHFSRCSEINRLGPKLIKTLNRPVPLKPLKFQEALEAGALVVDTRQPLAFAAAHVPGSYGLSLKGNFATFSGWVLPADRPVLLVMEESSDLEEALRGLYAVGIDQVQGFLKGGMEAWIGQGQKTERLTSLSVGRVKQGLEQGSLHLVDTRQKNEFEAFHIEGSIHMAAPELRQDHNKLPKDRPLAFICNTGYRSLLAASLMKQANPASEVIHVLGGTTAWEKQGYPFVR